MARKNRHFVRQSPKIYGNLQRKPLNWGRLWLILKLFFWLVVLAEVVNIIFFSTFFQITKVYVTGNQFTTAESVQALVPMKSNLLFFNKNQLAHQILENPVISSVNILKGLPNSLKIVLQERPPTLIWESGSTASILDTDGLVFAQYPITALLNNQTSLGQSLQKTAILVDTKAIPVKMNQQVVSDQFISFIQEAVKQMKTLLPQFPINHWEISDSTYDLTMVSNSGLRVIFNTLGDPDPQVRNLTRLIQQGNIPAHAQIDLRIDRWAFVKSL
jgi:hypothetical protein